MSAFLLTAQGPADINFPDPGSGTIRDEQYKKEYAEENEGVGLEIKGRLKAKARLHGQKLCCLRQKRRSCPYPRDSG